MNFVGFYLVVQLLCRVVCLGTDLMPSVRYLKDTRSIYMHNLCIFNTFSGNLSNGRITRLTKYVREVSSSKIEKKGLNMVAIIYEYSK